MLQEVKGKNHEAHEGREGKYSALHKTRSARTVVALNPNNSARLSEM